MTDEQKQYIDEFITVRDQLYKQYFGKELYKYQIEPSNKIIEYAVLANGEELPIEISRQAGKTEDVVITVAILMTFFPTIMKRPIRVGIFAPQQEQAKTDFDRIKDFFTLLMQDGFGIGYNESNGTTIDLTNGSMCYAFPVSMGSHPESKTLDLIILEESQDLIDQKIDKAVIPMGASTNAPVIRVGTSGYRICDFKKLVETAKVAFRIPAPVVIKERRKAFEKDGNDWHLNYEKHFNKRIELKGLDNDEIQTQYLLKWLVGKGQFTTPELFKELRDPELRLTEELNDSYNKFFGLDTAKSRDETVLTILRDLGGMKLQLIALLVLKGDNYEDQFEAIKGFLGKFNNVQAGAIDSTGQGDFMPDKFVRHTQWKDDAGLFRVKFGLQTKDVLYKDYSQVVKGKVLSFPDYNNHSGEEERHLIDFEQQHFDLVKEYKGIYLSCHHPEHGDAHDDYPDAMALAVHAWKNYNQTGGGILEWAKEQATSVPQNEALNEILRLMKNK